MNIRPALVSDAPVIRAIYEPFVRHTSVSFEIDPPSVAEMERRILKCSETHGYFVAEQAGSVFGFAYASQYRIRSSYQSSAGFVFIWCQKRMAGSWDGLFTMP